MTRLATATVIGIHGPINSGKDTIANYIQALYPNKYRRYAFAKPLKEAVKTMFGFTDVQVEDRTLKEQVDPYWGFSPRFALQKLGTEYGRNMLDKDVWIKRAQYEHEQNLKLGLRTIITDVRFENEAAWIRSLPHATIIYIQAPDIVRDEKYNHESENGISRSFSDVIINNDKALGLDALYKSIEVEFER
jgi:hypothetical protein